MESLKNLSRRQPGYNDLTIGCTKPSTGKGGRLIISDAMTDKGPVDGSLWIFKADQGKKPNKQVKKPSKDCNREKEKERSDIIAWRERYLRAIKKFRENSPDKDIIYTIVKATERRKSGSMWKA